MRGDDRHQFVGFFVAAKEELSLLLAERTWSYVWLDRSRLNFRRVRCLNIKLHSRTSANYLLASAQRSASFPSLRECRDFSTRNIYRRTPGFAVSDRRPTPMVRVARQHAFYWCCSSDIRRESETGCESPSPRDYNPAA